ncbi:MAG: PAS-domain containing protein [Rhodospirillales bacterium]|nr:PAS-domain containing protein [Rhodospirillales bacterium]
MPALDLRDPARAVVATAATFALLVLVAIAYDGWQQHRTAVQRAERETQNARNVLVAHAARTFETITRTVDSVAELRRSLEAGGTLDRDAAFATLKAIHGGSPVMQGLGWSDADGNLVTSSRFRDPPPVNTSSQEHFRVHKDGARAGLHVAAPLRSQVDGNVLVLVSKRYEDGAGAFAGTINVSILPSYFTSLFRSLDLGPGKSVLLLRRDGMILAREPEAADWVGRSLAGTSPIFKEHLPRAEFGSFMVSSPIDGRDRIVSYGGVPDTDLIVAASVSLEDALANFHERLWRELPIIAIVFALGIGGAWMLVRLLRRNQQREQEAQAQSNALAEKTALLESVFATTVQGIAIYDRDLRLVDWNAHCSQLFSYAGQPLYRGARLEDILGALATHGEYAGAEPVQAVAERIAFARSGQVQHYQRTRGDGTVLDVQWKPMPNGFLAVTHTDITELKRSEAALAHARDVAERANRAKSEFLSRMSHELRTPLNAVIGFAQMLEMNHPGNLTETQKEHCRLIASGGHHLLHLVNEILDLARIEAGKFKMSIERVAVSDMLEEMRATMKPLADKAGVALTVAEAAVAPDIRADRLRLRQVLMNLVSNAIKYNRPGGSVALSAMASPSGRVRFMVADTGIGIPADQQEAMFEPFYRAGAEYTAVEGAGIGLAISRRLVEAMDGSIGFFSKAGEGSTFWVDLPTAENGSRDAGAAAPVPDARPGVATAGGFSLLYVEDNPANLRLMEHLVSTLPNVRMLSAATPQLGLDLAAAHRPSVIVLDVNLPEMSGYAVLERLQAMPETAGIPVIALSAAAMASDVQRGIDAGFFRYLTKPIDIRGFLAVLDEALAEAGRAPPPAAAAPAAAATPGR